jgi:hypothetical protein
MSERNEKMAMLLAAEAPAARDLSFEIAVMARIEQRRFVRAVARNIAVAAALAVVLALAAPQLDLIPVLAGNWSSRLAALLSVSTGDALLMATLVLAGFAAWYFRPSEA